MLPLRTSFSQVINPHFSLSPKTTPSTSSAWASTFSYSNLCAPRMLVRPGHAGALDALHLVSECVNALVLTCRDDNHVGHLVHRCCTGHWRSSAPCRGAASVYQQTGPLRTGGRLPKGSSIENAFKRRRLDSSLSPSATTSANALSGPASFCAQTISLQLRPQLPASTCISFTNHEPPILDNAGPAELHQPCTRRGALRIKLASRNGASFFQLKRHDPRLEKKHLQD